MTQPAPIPSARPAFRTIDPNGAPGPWGCNADATCTADAVAQWISAPDADGDTVPVFGCATHAPA